jgi:phospholipase C
VTATTRRTALTAAGAVAAGVAGASLPAWASGGSRRHRPRPLTPASPAPAVPTGIPPVKHVIVLMMENHSTDNLLGHLDKPGFDTLPAGASNPNAKGTPVPAFHLPDLCPATYLSQSWDDSHQSWDQGHNDGFVRAIGGRTPMGYYTPADIPILNALASHFPTSDRYFCSVLAQTYPNRRFLFCGTASGTISTTVDTLLVRAANGTIFDKLDEAGITWKDYFQQEPSPLIVPNFSLNPLQVARCEPFTAFYDDVKGGNLPAFTFLDPNYDTTSEENPQDIAYGENFVASVVQAVMDGPAWPDTVLFINYDEHGGWYDHVPPPAAVPPDNIPPMLGQHGTYKAGYDRYGFRVPFVVVSPWGRPNYVSHTVADHTSVLAFVERLWGLKPMTARDAAAHDLSDMFDLSARQLLEPPTLPAPPSIDATLARCQADGEHPTTPTLENQLPGLADLT